MGHISEMSVGSNVVLTLKVNDQKLIFSTEIVEAIEKRSSKLGYGVRCNVVRNEAGKVISFGNVAVKATIINKDDGRQYTFPLSACGNSRASDWLYLYSPQDSKPVNNRTTFRVVCGMKANISVGDDRKAYECFVHDISFSGVSFSFDPGKIPVNVGDSINAAIYDESTDKFTRLSAVVVRVVEEWQNGKSLIGARFSIVDNGVNMLVAKCQMKELKVRQDKEDAAKDDNSNIATEKVKLERARKARMRQL